jgi:hypothetical protein
MNYRLIFCLLLIVAMVGVVSADTLIVYPDVDGRTYRTSANSTYANLISGAGTGTNYVSTTVGSPALYTIATTDTNKFNQNIRMSFAFNKSTIPAGSTINSAYLNISKSNNAVNGLGNFTTTLVNGTLASYTTLSNGDYQLKGNTELITRQAYGNIGNANWSLNFNANGLSYVSSNNEVVIFLVSGDDVDGTFSGTWASNVYSGVTWYTNDETVTGRRPNLVISYTLSTPPVASFTCTKNFIRIPNSVTCTDSSTNTPTSWSWNWGDGSSVSTTQNPSHTYTKRGKWDIVLTATNAGGSNTTAATAVKVIGYENYW